MKFHSRHRLTAIYEFASNCDEYVIATAIATNAGLELLDIGETQGKILLGLDLKCDGEFLEQLKMNCNATLKCFAPNSASIFHPKVYGFATGNIWTFFVGSGNLTEGGLSKHNEVFVEISDQKICLEILNWFNAEFQSAKFISDQIISKLKTIPKITKSSEALDAEKLRISQIDAAFSEAENNEPYIPQILSDIMHKVVLMPANKAWDEYKELNSYICQANRSIEVVDYMAFYHNNRIFRAVPKILETRYNVKFDPDLHESPYKEIIESAIRNKTRDKNSHYDIRILSSIDSRDTIMLRNSIMNDIRKLNSRELIPFARNQRYFYLEDLITANSTSHLNTLNNRR